MGAQPWPTLSLLAVRTDGITPGPITVVQKGWIEHITGDEPNGEETLGTAEIS